jgi:arylsulfatase A-like enzyme
MKTHLITTQLAYSMLNTRPAFYIACLFLLFFVSCSENEKPTPPPNVIILMTDDQGYGDLGCHGNPIIQTPNLDSLYAESVRFTDFHVDPTCSPTRAALMTGHYSRRAGVWHTVMGRNLLRREETTMAELFKNAGYATGHFGK